MNNYGNLRTGSTVGKTLIKFTSNFDSWGRRSWLNENMSLSFPTKFELKDAGVTVKGLGVGKVQTYSDTKGPSELGIYIEIEL